MINGTFLRNEMKSDLSQVKYGKIIKWTNKIF